MCHEAGFPLEAFRVDGENPDWWGEPESLREERWRKDALRRLPAFTIDISEDRKGQYFDIRRRFDDIDFEILQALPKQRHLLLMTSRGRRFLCGHDERHWFVAEVMKRVSSVRDARFALIPTGMEEKLNSVSPSVIETRDNSVFKRQGEWFFFPVDLQFDESIIHRNEPIKRRAGSKPHICEELVREAGETVYIINGETFSYDEYRKLSRKTRGYAKATTNVNRVYARGSIRHSDHKTIRLTRWHHVQLNNERVSRNLAFLD